jgi:succinate dehydrogenase / fumarate reductase membrane anchor subunit
VSADNSFRTPRSRTLGLGSAHHGVSHFIVERVSGLAFTALALWAAVSAVRIAGTGFDGALEWIGHPGNAVLLAALLVIGLIHVKNAMQVVIEDYIHLFVTKAAILLINLSVAILAGALGVFAILKAALTGAL